MKVLVTGGSGFIGTNLIELLQGRGETVLNVDIRPPVNAAQQDVFRKADILDRPSLLAVFQDFAPSCVVHLAARTDVVENVTVEEGYKVNTLGTENVLEATKATSSVSRLIITSTQYVHGPGSVPSHDQDYKPHTVYGQSKIMTEEITRSFGHNCVWTIVRPTNIWGPWHERYRREFLSVLQKGLYFHPGSRDCVKSYGYVGNIAHQMAQILSSPPEAVNGATLYVGDRPVRLLDWVNCFSQELTGRDVRVIPPWALKSLARMGDAISWVTGKNFLITTSRFASMTQDYVAPMDKTLAVLGETPFSMAEGVRRTVAWKRQVEA